MPDRISCPPAAPSSNDVPLAYSYREAARALGVSERTLWSLANSGEIKSRKVGRRVLIPRDALIAYLHSSSTTTAV
jgi:excisionase family DNA binding protein